MQLSLIYVIGLFGKNDLSVIDGGQILRAEIRWHLTVLQLKCSLW